MSNKAIAEVIHSDIKINIFNENEKEKKFKDTKDSEEKKADGKIIAKNKGLEMKDQVVGYVEGISWHESHGINKDEDQRKHKMPIANRSTWIEHTPYGQPGGIDSPLNYDPESRNYFVKFVFIMLFIMLLLTIGFVALVLATPDIKDVFINHNLMFLIISLVIMLMLNYMMFCSECARHPPCNFICLVLTVIGMSILVAAITCRIRTNLIFYAFIATAAVVFVCVLLACSSFDFTKWYLYVVVIAVAFAAVATIISITMLLMNIHFKPVHIAILFIGTIINVVILIIELQTILGGRTVEIGESDYAIAAFMLYTSIIDLFLKIVQMLNLFDD